MTQTLAVVVLFIAGMACLPWVVRWAQQRQGGRGTQGMLAASKVVSALPVGPQQRVITVEVGPEHARTLLVLGVTAQNINCLHVMPAAPPGSSSEPLITFSQEMARASAAKDADV
jgi:flagellar protein FliO/FliZ